MIWMNEYISSNHSSNGDCSDGGVAKVVVVVVEVVVAVVRPK